MSFEGCTVFIEVNKMIAKIALLCYLLLNVIPRISASLILGIESLVDNSINHGSDDCLFDSLMAIVLESYRP